MRDLFISQKEMGVVEPGGSFKDYRSFGFDEFHLVLHQMLEENSMVMEEIDCVYAMAGPGSYTAMRVVDGMAQILLWQGKEVVSFYQFEVPFLAGVEEGSWVCPAYKGELLLHTWDTKGEKTELIKEEDYKFSGKEYSPTGENLLLNHSPKIFATIKNRRTYLPPYYYRHAQREYPPPVR